MAPGFIIHSGWRTHLFTLPNAHTYTYTQTHTHTYPSPTLCHAIALLRNVCSSNNWEGRWNACIHTHLIYMKSYTNHSVTQNILFYTHTLRTMYTHFCICLQTQTEVPMHIMHVYNIIHNTQMHTHTRTHTDMMHKMPTNPSKLKCPHFPKLSLLCWLKTKLASTSTWTHTQSCTSDFVRTPVRIMHSQYKDTQTHTHTHAQ